MFKTVLYPLDSADYDNEAAHILVRDFVKSCDASLTIMTVVPDYGINFVAQYLSEQTEEKIVNQRKNELLNCVKKYFLPKKFNIKIDSNVIIKCGSIYHSIIEVAEKINADLVMLPAHKPGIKKYLLGPNVAKVVRHSECSVFVIRT